MKIYTKRGDQGQTDLIGGSRVSKNHIRIEAYGSIDELNSWMGLIRSFPDELQINEDIIFIQGVLFNIASFLATDERANAKKSTNKTYSFVDKIKFLENKIDFINNELPALKNFIIQGGNIQSSYTHIARSVCRRAERKIIGLSQEFETDKNLIIFVNRLSDYLFSLARFINYKQNVEEIIIKNEL
ncbi:MAG: cob(I)yrinic acid a,c-diamide adenosyltransferase [Bacteroidales bacterium]|nr:cob(I)yrinic acid a,c-diamide adenosyltransferase [Bacteroidales bacterium]